MVILRFYKQMKNSGLGNGERGEKTLVILPHRPIPGLLRIHGLGLQ